MKTPKTPSWVIASMHRLGLVRRDEFRCECGEGGPDIGNAPDCDQYKIATCPDCGKQWAIYTGRR